jgi:hypothetical protein
MTVGIGGRLMRLRAYLLVFLLPPLAACNMVISETPVFADGDRASVLPKDGVWLGDDPECLFDFAKPESEWPECAFWIVVRDSGTELRVEDGKGQTQRVGGLFANGSPAIVQGEWIDEAKKPLKAYYAFYGLEPRNVGSDGRFTAATLWPVECGIQDKPNGEIRPFPGISPECRPTSKDAIRSAAAASRKSDEAREWHWLRAESR